VSWSFVKATGLSSNPGALTVTVGITPTNAGDLLVADVYDGSNSGDQANVTCADNVNAGGYSQDGFNSLTSDGDTCCTFSHFNVAASATNVTATRTAASGGFFIRVTEYTGGPTTNSKDGAAVTGYNAGSTSISSSTLTPSASGDLLHATVGFPSGATSLTAGGSFTVGSGQFTANDRMGSCYQVLAGSGATALAMTTSPSQEWASIMVGYKLSAGGGASYQPYMDYQTQPRLAQ